jgi:integrase
VLLFSNDTMLVRLFPTGFPTVANIAKRGDKWRAEVCIDRKRKAKTFLTKREAVAWANEQEESGISPTKTLSDLIDRYKPIAETHKGSQAELSRLNHLDAKLGHRFVELLTPSALTEYRDSRLKEVSPVSVRRELIILSAMFEIAVNEWQWMRSNPLKSVKKPIASPARRRGVTQEEIDAICANLCAMRVGKQVSQMFLLSIETGMRLGELLSLKWSDVSDKHVTLRETKNGDIRHVPLSQKARDIVNSRREIDPDSVFTLSNHVASKTFQRATINGCHFHDARSEAVTRLSKRLDVMQLAKMIGHRDLKSLMLYYSEKPEDIADML